MRSAKFISRLPALLTASMLTGAALALAWPVPAGAQTGSLGTTSGIASEPGDRTAKVPSAAPRIPVQTMTKTPVVPPHGPTHPQKPAHPQPSAGHAKPVNPAKPAGPAATATQAKPAQDSVPATAVQGAAAANESEAKGAAAEKLPDPEKPEGSAPKLPRFASLRSDEVNMRAGPGARYRIDWIYRRRDLPVEIEREFDVWRWVTDADGVHGWVHQATLMGRRSFIVQKSDATLRSDASDSASAVAILKSGVVGRIRSCEAGSDWCNVSTGSYRGYLRRSQFWGLLPGEVIAP
jgi:SH3-like domain-containing protein